MRTQDNLSSVIEYLELVMFIEDNIKLKNTACILQNPTQCHYCIRFLNPRTLEYSESKFVNYEKLVCDPGAYKYLFEKMQVDFKVK